MARTSLVILLAIFLSVLTGCYGPDSGRSQLIPKTAARETIPDVEFRPADTSEADVVEQVAIQRQAYEEGLKMLISYYTGTGNDMKLLWAEDEFRRLHNVPQYIYIVEAIVAGPELRATETITEADYMYDDARRTDKKARQWLIIIDENLLRVALAKYNQIIQRHPSSDKIDDAAYYAGQVCEHFQDYSIALLYYQRTYQWNPDTAHPAYYRAAYILDKKMHRRAEALPLYQEFVERGYANEQMMAIAQNRINALLSSEQELQPQTGQTQP
ncbi:MAG: tetratricopeptide repeat protein [Planctomycetota bacterium]|jgi:tetratricopeptide (TPR) repeat protein